jgi:hypothetical protein
MCFMQWQLLIGPTVTAAIVSGLVSLITLRVNQATAREMQAQKLAFDQVLARERASTDASLVTLRAEMDKQIAQMKADNDLDLMKQRVMLENPTRAGAQNSLRILFDNPRYPQRSRLFSSIKKTIRGFDDDELRKILVGMGATAVRMSEGQEGWHLDE